MGVFVPHGRKMVLLMKEGTDKLNEETNLMTVTLAPFSACSCLRGQPSDTQSLHGRYWQSAVISLCVLAARIQMMPSNRCPRANGDRW